MSKIGGRRNYGYGKTMTWAGKQALKDRFGVGRYATRLAHGERWARFAAFAKETGVRDARDVNTELIGSYGGHLAEQVQSGAMKVAYAQNLLSSVNVVLSILRRDRLLCVSPAKLVGQRCNLRQSPPAGLDTAKVAAAATILRERNEPRAACVAELARHLGLRFREASLIDARVALAEANTRGEINVVRGTKGGRGRSVDRWVPVTAPARDALAAAAALQKDARSLVPAEQTYHQWRMHAYGVWRRATKSLGLAGFHDLRAAYACERYQQLTRAVAPVIAGGRGVSRECDKAARQVIALELGHGRADVVGSYIGSAR